MVKRLVMTNCKSPRIVVVCQNKQKCIDCIFLVNHIWSTIGQCRALPSLKYLFQRGVHIHIHIHIFRHHTHLLVLLDSKVTQFSAYDSIFGGHIGFIYIRSSPIL